MIYNKEQETAEILKFNNNHSLQRKVNLGWK